MRFGNSGTTTWPRSSRYFSSRSNSTLVVIEGLSSHSSGDGKACDAQDPSRLAPRDSRGCTLWPGGGNVGRARAGLTAAAPAPRADHQIQTAKLNL